MTVSETFDYFSQNGFSLSRADHIIGQFDWASTAFRVTADYCMSEYHFL